MSTEKEKERLRKGGAPPGVPHIRWKRVIEAKEFLERQAGTYAKLHLMAIKRAIKDKDYDTAIKASEWMLSHLAATDKDGNEIRPVSSSIDKQVEQKGSTQPQIIIGFRVGGMGASEVPQIQTEPLRELPEVGEIVQETTISAVEAEITSPTESES